MTTPTGPEQVTLPPSARALARDAAEEGDFATSLAWSLVSIAEDVAELRKATNRAERRASRG